MKFRIKEARESAGYTQAELAEKLGINAVTLSGYETGKHDPKSEMLVKIALILGVTVDYLLNRNDPPADILYISRPSGDLTTDELRKELHDLIDQLPDEDLVLFKDLTLRMKRE